VGLFKQDAKVEALRRAPLFEGLSKAELAELARVAEDMEVGRGQALTREGDSGREFFVLMDGEVEVTRGDKKLGRKGSGDFIGEIALLEDMPRTATVTALTPLRLFVLTGPAFRQVVEKHPEVESKVLRALARRLHALGAEEVV
jgi:CRP-like cAMP-binding protein